MQSPKITLVSLIGLAALTTAKEIENSESKELVEDPGTGRILPALFFPLLPQFYNLDYGSVLEFFTQPDTIGYFVIRDISAVSDLNNYTLEYSIYTFF